MSKPHINRVLRSVRGEGYTVVKEGAKWRVRQGSFDQLMDRSELLGFAGYTPITLWAIYDHPTDHPDAFVARRWTIHGTALPTLLTFVADDIEKLRSLFAASGLTAQAPFAQDDPVIVECWL